MLSFRKNSLPRCCQANTLDEVYREWCDNSEWHGIDDISLALEETADRIQISIDRKIAKQKATLVAAYGKWKQLGRQAEKGETGI